MLIYCTGAGIAMDHFYVQSLEEVFQWIGKFGLAVSWKMLPILFQVICGASGKMPENETRF